MLCHFTNATFLLTIGLIGSFLLAAEFFLLTFAYSWSVFTYSLRFLLSVELFFTYSGKVYLISTSVSCKQNNSTVSKKVSTVSKKTSP